jgi:hypothetical protein
LSGDRFEAIVVDGTAKRWKVVNGDAGVIPPAADNDKTGEAEKGEDNAAATLSAALKKLGAPHDPVSLAVPSSGSVFRNIQLPFTGDDAIRKVLKFESESYLHQFNIEDVILVHVPVHEHKGATDLILAAAPKRFLKSRIDVMERAGYDPATVDLDAFSLFNAVLATHSIPPTGTALVVHIGRDETLVLMVEEGKLRMVRSIRMAMSAPAALESGNGNKTDALVAGLEEAQIAAAREGGSAETQPSDDLVVVEPGDGALVAEPNDPAYLIPEDRREDFLRRLQREAVRTVAAESRRNPDEVLVCGEGAAVPGLIEGLGAALNLPARELDLFESVDGAPADPIIRRRLAIALGAGLKPLGIDHTQSNFRQEELRFAKKLESIKAPLAALAASLAFLLLLQNIYMFREVGGQEAHLASDAMTAERMLREVPPGQQKLQKAMAAIITKSEKDPPADRLRNYANRLDEEIRGLKDVYGTGGASFSKPQSSWEATQRFFEFMKKHQDELGAFVIDRYTASTNTNDATNSKVTIKMTLTFLGSGQEATARCALLRKSLKEQRWCEDSREGTLTPVDGDVGVTYEGFTIVVDLAKETAS